MIALFGLPAALRAEAPEMDFVLVRAQGCQEHCPVWISAEGRIVPSTPKRFKRFLAKYGADKPSVVFQSEGGDVEAAYALGRMIRKAGLETAVGGTRLKGCKIAEPRCSAGIHKSVPAIGTTFASGAYCLSACPFAFAGGVIRAAASFSELGVHQITTVFDDYTIIYRTETKIVNGKSKVVKREVGRKQRVSYKLSPKHRSQLLAYFDEMGVSRDLIILIGKAWASDMYYIRMEEAQKLGLVTEMIGHADYPGLRRCGPTVQQPTRCRLTPSLQAAAPQSAAADPAN
jgi:hypothetical protein